VTGEGCSAPVIGLGVFQHVLHRNIHRRLQLHACPALISNTFVAHKGGLKQQALYVYNIFVGYTT
jgi:hypothetical protein